MKCAHEVLQSADNINGDTGYGNEITLSSEELINVLMGLKDELERLELPIVSKLKQVSDLDDDEAGHPTNVSGHDIESDLADQAADKASEQDTNRWREIGNVQSIVMADLSFLRSAPHLVDIPEVLGRIQDTRQRIADFKKNPAYIGRHSHIPPKPTPDSPEPFSTPLETASH